MGTIRAEPSRATALAGAFTRWYRSSAGALGALLFPFRCPICGGTTEGESAAPFCEDCRKELIEASFGACPRCALSVGPWAITDGGCSVCRGQSLGFDAAVALGPYQGLVRQLCLTMKNGTHGWVAPWAGQLLAEVRPQLSIEVGAPGGVLVVPVPLHWRRFLGRRYNQSEEIGYGLALRLGLETSNVLRRVVHTEILALRGRDERVTLLRGAFRVRRRYASRVAGRTVLLVDDVLTSGATCGEAARTLKKAGAARVVAVVVGRAEGRL